MCVNHSTDVGSLWLVKKENKS